MAARARFPWGLSVAAAVVFAILFGLGVWQLERKGEKTRDLHRLATLSHAAPTPLADALTALSAGRDVAFTHVVATCTGLDRARFTELYALIDGHPGVRLISACAAPGGRYGGILVDRGFIDADDRARPPSDARSTAPVTVTGVLRKPDAPNWFTPKRGPAQPLWFSRDVAGMSRVLGLNNPAPLMLIADASTNPDQPELRAVPLPGDDINSRKGEYAPTWFGLALVLAAFYAAMLTKRLRGDAS